MNAIKKLFVATLKMTFRNRQAMIWTFVLPVVLMVLFGLAFGKSSSLTVKVGVVDQAKNALSKQYINGLEKISSFNITKGSRQEELDAMKAGNRAVVVVLPKGFGDSVKQASLAKQQASAATAVASKQSLPASVIQPKVEPSTFQVYLDKSNPNISNTAKLVLNQIVLTMNQKMTGTPDLFKMQEKSVSARRYSTIDFYAAGIMSMFIMNGGVMAVVMIIVGYRERGILTRLKATPLSLPLFLGTQILVRVVIALAQMLLLLGIAIFVFGAHVAGSWWLLSLLVIEGSLVFIAMGFGIASFARNNQTAQAVSQIIIMPMMFLSGVFFPTDTFPKFIQPVIHILPLTYLADSLRNVMMRGEGFNAVAGNMLILAVFGLVIFAASVFSFRWE